MNVNSESVMGGQLKILSVSVSGLLSGGANLLTPAGALIEARRIILAEREARELTAWASEAQ